jgi:hypothetical protein
MPEFLGPRDHTPSLLGLFELTSGDEIGPIVWAPALALLAVGTAWRGASSPRAVAITAAGVCALIGIGTSAKFVSVSRVAEPTRLALPSNATYLTWVGGGTVTLWETLFWNPQVNRVAVLGVGGAPDGYAFIRARLAPGARLVDEAGSVLAGPYVIGPEVVALGVRTLSQKTGAVALLPTAPSAIVFGLYRQLGRLGIAGMLYATAVRPSTLSLELRSPGSRRTAHLRCDDGLKRKIDLGSQGASVLLRLSPTTVRSCRFFIVGAVGAEATVRLGQ